MTRRLAFYGGSPTLCKAEAAANVAALLARGGAAVRLVEFRPGHAAALLEQSPNSRSEVSVLDPLDPDVPDQARKTLAALSEDPDHLVMVVPDTVDLARCVLPYATDVVMVVGIQGEPLQDVAHDLGVLTELMASGATDLEIRGVLITGSDRRLEAYEKLLIQIERSFPVEVFPFCVPRAQNPTQGVAVEIAPLGRRARAYVELAMEVMGHGG